jgi:RNA 2',3'-cyclic 3'-phosphodiesterase
MRLFVAIDIDPQIRAAIAQFVEGIRGFAPDVRWVSPESLHITLKFIGEWQRVDELKAALAAVRGEPVQISFGGTGFFPTAKSPRVFWIGVEAPPQLGALARSIDEATSKLGIESEKRDFTPHLTLARSGSGRPQRTSGDRANSLFPRLQKRLETMPPPSFGTMTAREFFLFESKLSPKGAHYTKLERFSLE